MVGAAVVGFVVVLVDAVVVVHCSRYSYSVCSLSGESK